MKKTKDIVVRYGAKSEKGDLHDLAMEFLDYAILSSNVYCINEEDPEFIPIKSWQLYEKPLPGIPPPRFRSQKTICGLKYQVWWRQLNGKIQVAIVFKGTTFSFRNDWICNLRWLTMNPILKHFFSLFLWDYYHQVQVLTPIIIADLKNKFGNIPIEFIATGHSLGGGLAQQAAYSFDAIKKVIAFDPSPVTGYKDIKKELRLKTQVGIQTSRVFQQGEILSYFRDFIRILILPLSTKNPEIKEFEFSFLKGSAIKRHNIREFAIHLEKVLQN